MSLPFERTVCACQECVDLCKNRPGMLMPTDIEPILRKIVELELAPDLSEAMTFLKATPGAVALRFNNDGSMSRVTIPTVSPRTTDGHRCVFLDEHDRCKIHDVSPAGCAYFDTHQSISEGMYRSSAVHQLIIESEPYTQFRDMLVRRESDG